MSNSEKKTVDALGLSCPMPAMLARQALVEMSGGTVEVLVDNGTSCENVTRLAEREGWKVDVTEDADGNFKLVLTK
jgi:TusA-related sulfurtransferase